MEKPTLTPLPEVPLRGNRETFVPKKTAWMHGVHGMTGEMNAALGYVAWAMGLLAGAEAALTDVRSEVAGARLGEDTLALAMQGLAGRVQRLVEVQNAISMGQVAAVVGRPPNPNDDTHPPGFTWIWPGTDDFWVCVHVAPGAARWRRSDGQLTRRAIKPVVHLPAGAATNTDVVITLGSADAERAEVEWDATGAPVVVSGDLSGSDATTITLQWATAGEYTVRARVHGDDDILWRSAWSDVRMVLIGPAIYSGSGAWCGDGSYCGMML